MANSADEPQNEDTTCYLGFADFSLLLDMCWGSGIRFACIVGLYCCLSYLEGFSSALTGLSSLKQILFEGLIRICHRPDIQLLFE